MTTIQRLPELSFRELDLALLPVLPIIEIQEMVSQLHPSILFNDLNQRLLTNLEELNSFLASKIKRPARKSKPNLDDTLDMYEQERKSRTSNSVSPSKTKLDPRVSKAIIEKVRSLQKLKKSPVKKNKIVVRKTAAQKQRENMNRREPVVKRPTRVTESSRQENFVRRNAFNIPKPKVQEKIQKEIPKKASSISVKFHQESDSDLSIDTQNKELGYIDNQNPVPVLIHSFSDQTDSQSGVSVITKKISENRISKPVQKLSDHFSSQNLKNYTYQSSHSLPSNKNQNSFKIEKLRRIDAQLEAIQDQIETIRERYENMKDSDSDTEYRVVFFIGIEGECTRSNLE